MKDDKYYICKYCYKEFEPKRRRVQKFCSNTCRSKDFHARNTNKTTDFAKEALPKIVEQSKRTEKISIAGIGNATAGTLLANEIKSFFTSEKNKPARVGDIHLLIEKLEMRYHPINNRPPNSFGQLPYFDLMTNEIVFR
ncbi:hypothetical protein [Winogradskyella sp. MH6]|uniref:hypothetical protein n=1 Tax=Winogradskyella sp. MH6 TaxID=2929510 RepID=UPI001FB40913|nr:hypothetical protein [Winogradskyella sp. MH6]